MYRGCCSNLLSKGKLDLGISEFKMLFWLVLEWGMNEELEIVDDEC